MRYIYEGLDGELAVFNPSERFLKELEGTDEEKIIFLANKNLPTGTKYEILDDSVDISDRSFRNAWEYVSDSSVEKTSEDLSAEDLAKYNMKENL